MIDTEKLISEHSIENVISRYVSLKKDGREMVGVCPFHGDSDPSLMVNPKKRIFKCFSCGEGGDVIDFVQKIENVAFIEACSIITDNSSSYTTTEPVPVKEIKPEWEHVFPVDHAPASIVHYKHGVPSKVWTYRADNGGVIGFVCRFDFENGKKDVIPFCLGKKNNFYKWRWMGFARPRPIYNLDLISSHGKSLIIIVEGEKTADAVQAEFEPSEAIATTWIGGGNGVFNSDFSPLSGRNVVYWPDHDEPGDEAMLSLHSMIVDEVKSARWISVPDEFPRKWDAADKEWSVGEMVKFLKANVTSVPAVQDISSPE